MNQLELVVMERNRLVRFSILLSVVGFVLATWARDPLLNITTPFSGPDAGNITVGHAVLIGHPVLCVLFLVLAAQVFRYKDLVRNLDGAERRHLDWRLEAGIETTGSSALIRRICEMTRWFAMVAIPAVATGFLLDAQTEFRDQETNTRYTYKNMFTRAFNSEFYNMFYEEKLSYMGLANFENCEPLEAGSQENVCYKRNDVRQRILDRMPTLYQPYNFIFGLLLELVVIGSLIGTTRHYFKRDDDGEKTVTESVSV